MAWRSCTLDELTNNELCIVNYQWNILHTQRFLENYFFWPCVTKANAIQFFRLFKIQSTNGIKLLDGQNCSNLICSLFVTVSLIIQIYEGINSELFLESDLNRGHFNSDRDFFLSLIKKVEKEPTNLLSLLIQANKLLQMFQDFSAFLLCRFRGLYKHGEDNTISTINLWISWIISLNNQ